MGVGIRVEGLRRFYAVLLERPDKLVEADGRRTSAAVDGVQLEARDNCEEAFVDGGAASTDEVLVAPVHRSPNHVEASAEALAG